MNNVEKAKLMFQLFPNEIPQLLEFVKGVCDTITEHEDIERKRWQHGIVTFDFWLSLVRDIATVINRYGRDLHKSRQLFGDQLFDGQLALVMLHCLTLYTTTRQHPNQRFADAVKLLFG